MRNLIKNKKILLVGLGRLGGGAATAAFLAKRGAKLSVTDLNSAQELTSGLAKLKGLKIKYVLGKHREADFLNSDVIVFNQAVSANSKWARFAGENGKAIETDLSLMLKILNQVMPETEYIAITGTRGKTTTAVWTHHFLKPARIGGNIPALAPLKILDRILRAPQSGARKPLILEIPSYQLEYWELNQNLKAPKIAVITNLYVDHLNRHGNMKNYALAKSRVFSNQTDKDFLILNYDINNAPFFKRKPKSAIFYIALKSLPKNKNGLYCGGQKIIFQNNGQKKFVAEIENFSPHRKQNLLAALLVGYLYGKKWKEMAAKIPSLPAVPFRQEIVFKSGNLEIVNDSASTSPEGVAAAIDGFKPDIKKTALICGGADKMLDFKNLARKIKKEVPRKNLFLLGGSATEKLVAELEKLRYFKSKPRLSESVGEIIGAIKNRKCFEKIIFSPGAASFGKFKNEFDRGRKFNKIIKENFERGR